MRSVAVLGVLAGCNQIYGLDPTKVIDAGPPPRHVTLTYLIATEPAFGQHAIDFATPVRDVRELAASTLDGAQSVDLKDAYAASATVDVPDAIASQAWRLVYQIGDDAPREVQNPPANDLHLVAPVFGPLDRAAVPDKSGYSITPTGYVGSHEFHRVFTTGVWTEGFVLPSPATATVNYAFATAQSLFGPVGAPDPAVDQVVLVDYQQGCNGGLLSIGSTVPTQIALQAGKLTTPAPQPTWGTTPDSVTLLMDTTAALNALSRMKAIGDDGPATLTVGTIASDRMPAFEAAPRLPRVLPGPVLIFDAFCPWMPSFTVPTIPAYHPSGLEGSFVEVLHAEAASPRVVSGANLVSGMAVVTPRTGKSFAPDFAAPAVTLATLTGPGGDVVRLFDPSLLDEHVPVTDRGGAMRLDLTLFGPADYVEVTLHQVKDNAAVAVRRYVVVGTAVQIDPALFTAGAEYAFEVRTFTGRPGAALGDFRVASLPQAMVTMFTRTFVTP
jgi:hypothetical protein